MTSPLFSHNSPINKEQPEVSELCMWPLCMKENRRKILESPVHEGTGGKANVFSAIRSPCCNGYYSLRLVFFNYKFARNLRAHSSLYRAKLLKAKGGKSWIRLENQVKTTESLAHLDHTF